MSSRFTVPGSQEEGGTDNRELRPENIRWRRLYIFVLAAFVGYMVIQRVPPLLHTPLMAATNAISGISLVGSLIMAGAQHSRFATLLGFIAVVCATTNIVGGFLIVDRMLRMFQRTSREAGIGAREAEERRKAARRVTDAVT